MLIQICSMCFKLKYKINENVNIIDNKINKIYV